LEVLRDHAVDAHPGLNPGAFDTLKQEYQGAKRNAKNAEDWERYQ
jgi:hypothetical protein